MDRNNSTNQLKPKWTWKLNKYARLNPINATGDPQTVAGEQWKSIEDDPSAHLVINITVTGHMSIFAGTTILESYFLVDARKWLKGFCKNNCILISFKTREVNRLFRLQFSNDESSGLTSSKLCRDCAHALARYFNVKFLGKALEEDSSGRGNNDTALSTLPTISEVCSKILSSSNMPLLYQHCNYDITASDDDVEQFVITCLTDPNFPAFVGRVEKTINCIKNK